MQYGQNVEVALQDGKKGKRLVIEVDLGVQGTPSNTGKSIVIASTKGNKAILEAGVVVGLNVYRKV
jgi:hypothetical protein